MMNRFSVPATGFALVAAMVVAIAPAAAEAQIMRVSRGDTNQSINFNIGYFGVRGEDARIADDVLLVDLDDLAFDISDFNGATVGAEYLVGVGEYLEAGVGVGFYRRSVPSVYRDLTFEGGAEIEQDLRLRIVPFTASVRFLPAGRGGAVEPYVGAGIGIFNWRYSETGDFVDPFTDEIFRNRYVADGNAFGPVILAGLRGLVSDAWTIGGELRYQRAEGDLNSVESGLLTDKIDLGGWSANFTFGFRF